MTPNRMRPIHPGEILREEYLTPMGMSANAFAHAIKVPTNRMSEILREKRAVTADTALRLARVLRTTPEFWLNLQKTYELRVAETSKQAKKISSITPLRPKLEHV
jgi:antitoxin HigA-1